MGNLPYNEPGTLDTAFDVIGDVILSAAGQQYGGFTIPEIDKVLAYYAEKSYHKYLSSYCKIAEDIIGKAGSGTRMIPPARCGMEINKESYITPKAHEYAMEKVTGISARDGRGWNKN